MIYIVISVLLNIFLGILGFVPFIISVSYALDGKIMERMQGTMANRIEGYIMMIFIILFVAGANFILYKIMSKKADLKWKWSIIPFMTIVITNIYIVIAQNLW